MYGFAALEVGEKHEPLAIEELQEHRSKRGRSVAVDGGQRHGVGLGRDALAGFLEPLLELHDRVRVKMLSFEGAADVFPARLVDGLVVGHEKAPSYRACAPRATGLEALVTAAIRAKLFAASC